MSGGLPDPEEDLEIEVDDGEDFEFDFEASLDFDLPPQTHAQDQLIDVIERVVPGAGFTAEMPDEELWDPGTPSEARSLWGKGWDIHAALEAANALNPGAPAANPAPLDAPDLDALSIPEAVSHSDAFDEPIPPLIPRRGPMPIWVIGAAAAAAMVLMLVALVGLSAMVVGGSSVVNPAEPVIALPTAATAVTPPVIEEPELNVEVEVEPIAEPAPDVATTHTAAAEPAAKPAATTRPAAPAARPAVSPASAPEPAPKKKGLFGRKKKDR